MAISPIEDILADYQAGKMVILMDDEDRENEGDLLIAAEVITPEAINFMATYGRGLICLTLTEERCSKLRLPLMVSQLGDSHSTAFTVSIEAARGVTTGISAQDRALTIQAAVAPHAGPDDIVMPGHIFPLRAKKGGVLTRPGHTEAGVDLARLAGFQEPSSVIVEIMKDDGTMARRDDLEIFAEKHGIKLGTIADLVRYRIQHEKAVQRVSSCALPTPEGEFQLIAYEDLIMQQVHFALIMGDISGEEPVLVRVHMQDTLCDLLGSQRESCGWSLRQAKLQIAQQGRGVIVVLRKRDSDAALLNRIDEFHHADAGVKLHSHLSQDDLKTYGQGAQILADLGLKKIRIIGGHIDESAMSGFGLEVMEYVEKQA